ncbi:MAG TPA: hypothetical protein DCR43_04765 [Bacteroidales bacterium]|nr:MAG: hypothetical protein A2X09_01490 [Bacteroidetes bacterium GWF2_43_11]HAQ65151.1 hypothetical protein [Bacteroidales bacterium]HBZ65844.1 hypothetical protein [Bacteroidales bacterium]
MIKQLQICVLVLVFSMGAVAQQVSLSGKVTSAEDGNPLPGVTIKIKESIRGTISDLNGMYNLDVEKGQTLIFSFMGFENQEIVIQDQRKLDVVLVTKGVELGGVVVTALGVKRQQREIGYSTEKISTTDLVRAGSANVLSAITGKSAGVLVSNNDGVEGGSTRVTIRGNNNLNGNNQPLIVVDNVPMDNTPGLEDIGRGIDWGNGIADLNAYDIEDYTVLKGGAAAALYGSRGANGVILITTKRGKKQNGVGITYNLDYKIVHPYRYRDVQNVYGSGGPITLLEPTFPLDESGTPTYLPYGNDHLVINQQGTTSTTSAEFGYYGSSASWGPKMEGQMIKWWDGEMRPYSAQPDNLKAPFSDGHTVTHNIEANAGSDKGTLRVSLTRQDNTPIISNSNFDRTTINLGANMKVSEKLKADVTLTYVKYNRLNSPVIGEDANSINKGLLYGWGRSYKGLDRENYQLADGSRNSLEGYQDVFPYVDNYIWWNYYNNNTTLNRDKYTGALSLTYDVTPWINITGRIGRDFSMEQYENRTKPTDYLGLQNGSYSNSLSKNYSDNFDLIITANRENIFGTDLNVRLTTGANRYDQNYYYIYGHSGTWYYPNMYTFFNYTETVYTTDDQGNTIVSQMGDLAEDVVAQEKISKQRVNSVYAFLNLGWKNYLFADITGRNDWSSTLPSDNNSFFYPSISLSFIASEAFKVQEKIPWLNFLKIKGGVAQTASGTDPYRTKFYYTIGLFGGQQTATFPGEIPPIALKPQRVNAYEGGFNLGLFDNRIDLDFVYYYKYSFDQILNLPVPESSGSANIKINEGVLSNRGLEITINAVPIQTRNIVLRTGLNFSLNRNKIISLGDYSDTYLLADIWGLNGPAIVLQEGSDYGTIVGYDYVYDANGNRIVNDEGTKYEITDTRVPIGNASPDFTTNFTTNFTYKNFTVSTLVDAKIGGDIYCGSYVIGLQTGQSPETLLEREGGGLPYTDPEGNVRNVGVILEGVHADGTPNTTVVNYLYKYMPNAGGWGKFVSTPGIVENTWIKMREISISYTLPQSLIHKLKFIQNLRLSITGRDLFYFYTTIPDNINPEGIMGSGNAQGFEWASYPGTRSFMFGLSATF